MYFSNNIDLSDIKIKLNISNTNDLCHIKIKNEY